MNPGPGFRFGTAGAPAPPDVIREPIGRIAIGHSHELGRPVTGHWSVQAVLLGAGNEHMPRAGSSVNQLAQRPSGSGPGRPYDDYLQLAARSGIWLTPTREANGWRLMAHEHPEVLDDPVLRRLVSSSVLERMKEDLKERMADPSAEQEHHQIHLDDIRRFRELGGKVLAGTDNPLPGISLHWELQHLVDAGMTPMEALLAASRDAATALGYADDLGTLEVGKIADIVLLNADPLADIGNTLRIAMVIHDGRVVDREALLGY